MILDTVISLISLFIGCMAGICIAAILNAGNIHYDDD